MGERMFSESERGKKLDGYFRKSEEMQFGIFGNVKDERVEERRNSGKLRLCNFNLYILIEKKRVLECSKI